MRQSIRAAVAVAAAAAVSLVAVAAASAHARIAPSVTVSGQLELYSLVVPTEKAGATTTKIELTMPVGFSIDSFVPTPGWKRVLQQTGSGENAVIQKVTWSGGHTPTEDDSLFQFLGEAASSKTYTFQVEQTYSDGEIVDWSGPESSANPAPTVEAKSSLGGGGSSTIAIVALVVGAIGVVLGVIALVSRGGRQLA
jgi:periplasmic copper chaperone A